MPKVFMLLASLLLLSCTSDGSDIKTNSLNSSWIKSAEQRFDFDIDQAQNPKNIIFVVRNNNTYPYSNIRFIVKVSNLKTKKAETDTVEYTMAKPDGEWLGKGFGEIKEIHFPYRTNYRFPQDGTYSIGIIQAMRNDTLKGIEDIGVKIENTKP